MIRKLSSVALALVALLVLAPASQAKDKDDKRGNDNKSSKSGFGNRDSDRHDHRHDDNDRRRFFAQPRTSFTITLGNGYAGRGYYYGPPNCPYYYQGSGIVYYSSRERVPQHHWGSPAYRSTEASVQRALAQKGYYRGPADGKIGPATRAAIAHYQRDRRLAVTGNINNQVLSSLGLK